MAEPFNHDGPVKVNETDFDIYKTLFNGKQPSFNALFFYWFDEHHADGVRRLALRDIFRQSSRHPIHAYHRTDTTFGSITSLLKINDPKESSARKTLCYRPKLLNELIDEFLYAAQNHHIQDDQRSIHEFIEYLIPLTDETTGRQLFSHHKRWTSYPFSGGYVEDHIEPLLEDIINENYPAWVRKEIWEGVIKKHCETEVANLKKTDLFAEPITISHIRHCHRDKVDVTALNMVSQFVGHSHIYQSEKDFTLITEIVKFLNNELPANVAYIEDYQMTKLVFCLTDTTVAFDCIRRHIFAVPEKNRDRKPHSWLNFLYWIHGLTTHTHPDDTELLTEIDRGIAKIHSQP